MLLLADIRKSRGYSQTELAKLLEVSKSTIVNWEVGHADMKADALWRACEALGCTPNDMLGWYDDHDRDIKSELPSITYAVVELMDKCTPERKAQVYSYAADCAALSKNGAVAQGGAIPAVA